MTRQISPGMDSSFPFAQLGITRAEAEARIDTCFDTLFFDPQEKIWLDVDTDSACIVDTGNMDARTEGMSYGMMMCVQRNRQDLFDKLWRFTRRYMLLTCGPHTGYFAWSVALDGTHNAEGPAPDGEEYFAMALLLAADRWQSGEFDYAGQAREILRHCIHQSELVPDGEPMWDRHHHLIKFVPQTPFSDPSYHLPHFYECFARLADEGDRPFWREAAKASRRYIALAAHPVTGLSPEYAEFDGTPRFMFNKPGLFYSDAYRVALNIGLDHAWCGDTPELTAVALRLQSWLLTHPEGCMRACMLDGSLPSEEVMHPVGLLATTAAAGIACGGDTAAIWMQRLWDTPLRKGPRRYYDNCLYFFSLLALSGAYQGLLH